MSTLGRELNNSRKLRHSFVDNEYADTTQYSSKNVHFDMGSKKRGSA